jgi:sarcosine oxidase, subunit alpha
MQLNPQPKRLSPLHNRHQTQEARFDLRGGWLVPQSYVTSAEENAALQESVGLLDISAQGKLMLKGNDAGAIVFACFGEAPTKPGDVIVIKSSHIVVAELTPDEYLMLTPPGTEKEIANTLKAESASQDSFVSIIDQTSGLVGLSISGQRSTSVMKKLCAISFNTKDFPNLCVAQSSFANVRTTIVHHDQGVTPTFALFADRSYGVYLWDTIQDAGREFGMQPVGWEAIGG